MNYSRKAEAQRLRGDFLVFCFQADELTSFSDVYNLLGIALKWLNEEVLMILYCTNDFVLHLQMKLSMLFLLVLPALSSANLQDIVKNGSQRNNGKTKPALRIYFFEVSSSSTTVLIYYF